MVRTYYYNHDKDIMLTPHFKVGDFINSSQVASNIINISDELPSMLEKLYAKLLDKYNLGSIVITSGYHPYEHDILISNDIHMQGKACDIICYNQDGTVIDNQEVCCLASDVGFNGIGYGGTYTHVDVGDDTNYFDETNGRVGIDNFYKYFNISKENIRLKYQLGDHVKIAGIYKTSNDDERQVPRVNQGIITKIVNDAKNPYLLNGGNIGWIREKDIISN